MYVLRSRVADTGSANTAGGLSVVAVAIGAGCAACGTSIITPILAAAGATGTIGLARQIGVLANIIGFGLVLWSLYGLGKRAAAIQAAQKLSV